MLKVHLAKVSREQGNILEEKRKEEGERKSSSSSSSTVAGGKCHVNRKTLNHRSEKASPGWEGGQFEGD